MTDPRTFGSVTVDGVTFKTAFVAGAKGLATVFLPGAAPVPDPNGSQAEQSQGRIVFDLGEFEVRFDLVPDADPLPGYAPEITLQNLVVSEDGTLTGQFTATDVDNNVNPNSWVQIGSVVGFALAADGSFAYTPPGSFQSLNHGETATVAPIVRVADTDGNQSADTAFDITITGAADAPTVTATPVFVTDAATALNFDLFATDPENDVAADGFTLSTPPAKGVVTVAPSGLGCEFDPNGDFDTLGGGLFEDVTFGVKTTDNQDLLSAERVVTMRVTGAAAAPIATPGGVLLNEDQTTPTAFDLSLLCAAAPGGAPIVSYELVTMPANVTLANFNAATGQGTLLPVTSAFQALKAGQTATRPFSFRCVSSNGFISNAATFTPTIQGAEDAPVAVDRTVNVSAGAAVSSFLTWSDVDSVALYASGPAFEFVGAPFDVATGATVGVGQFTLLNATHQTVGPDVSGAVRFDSLTDFNTLPVGQIRTIRQLWRLRGDDGVWGPNKKLNAVVTGVDQATDTAPVMVPVNLSTNAGVPVAVNLIGSTTDNENDFSHWEIVSPPMEGGVQKGTFVLSSDGTYPLGRLTYSPGNNYDALNNGSHAFPAGQVRAIDLNGNPSNTVDVTIDVLGVAQAPVAVDYAFSVNANATFSGSVPAATDANGNLNANGYALVDGGAPATDGVITFNANGTFTYNPNGVFNGLPTGQSTVRTFTYTASDTTVGGAKVSSPKNIAVTINGTAAVMGPAPMYPAPQTAALSTKYPFEITAMSRFMALKAAFPETKTSVKSGSWTDPTVWTPPGVPQAGDNVCIEYGHNVVLNEARTAAFTGNKAYGFVCVEGTLTFAPFMNVRLRCDTLWGSYSGHLAMQPTAANVIHEISVPPNGDIDTAKDPALLTRGIIWHGTVKVMGYGAETPAEKDPYVNCLRSAFPVAGATSVQLATAPVGWQIGDRIIIPCAEQDRCDGTNIPAFEDEEVTITAINGAVISFTPALAFNHNELPAIQTHAIDFNDGKGGGGNWPELAICNFSRNIKFTNEAGNTLPVHQRPHIMIMHRPNADGIEWCDSEINDFGRTNKLVAAFTPGQMGANPIIATSNMKGRYALHLHWVGVDPVDDINHGMAEVERNAFYRSPGWAFALHRGVGCVEDNVSFDAFGHYVAEAGDETGEWQGNVAIRARARRSNTGGLTGTVKILKSYEFVNRHDHAATGQGFFFMGRLIHAYASARGWNRVYGSHGDAIVWMHRPGTGFISPTLDFGPHYVNAANWEFGGAAGWQTKQWEPDKPRIGRSQHWQVTGCFRGIHVVKNAPLQEHDLRTFFDDVIITGAVNGCVQQYTQHYSNRRWLVVRGKRLPTGASGEGFVIYNNTPDMLVSYSKIGGHPAGVSGGFRIGLETTHVHVGATAEPVAGSWGYIFDSIEFGAQFGGTNNVNDMPTFLENRTGQDGVTGPEDLAFNMTFRNPQAGAIETFGPPPNPYSMDVHSLAFYRATSALNPPAATTWDSVTQNFQYLGTVTDAYGVKRIPAYYGPLDAFQPKNGSNDWLRRTTAEVAAILAKKGYWTWQGQFYVEDEVWSSNRTIDVPVLTPRTLYISGATPGVNGTPPTAAFGSQIFTLNGSKAPGAVTPPTSPQKYYTRFTINHATTIEAGQPILLHHLHLPGGAAHLLFQKAQADLGDLKLYTDATLATRLPLDKVAYDAATGRLLVWTRRSTATPAGTQIWAEFGGATGQAQPAPNAAFGSQAVWAGFNTVSHNFTTNAVNGGAFTIFGTTLIGTNTIAPVAALNGYPGRRFNGTNTDSANIVVSSAVAETFFEAIYREGPGPFSSGRVKHSQNGPDLGFKGGSNAYSLQLEDTNSGAGGSHADPEFTIPAVGEDQWSTIGYVRSGETTPRMLSNGVAQTVTTVEGFTGTFVPSNENTAFGNHHPDNRDRGWEGGKCCSIMIDVAKPDAFLIAFDAMVRTPAAFAAADAGGTQP